MNTELMNLKLKIEDFENLISENQSENYDEKYFDLKNEIEEIKDFPFNEFERNIFESFLKKLNNIGLEIGAYDAEAELDAMFPNGQDE